VRHPMRFLIIATAFGLMSCDRVADGRSTGSSAVSSGVAMASSGGSVASGSTASVASSTSNSATTATGSSGGVGNHNSEQHRGSGTTSSSSSTGSACSGISCNYATDCGDGHQCEDSCCVDDHNPCDAGGCANPGSICAPGYSCTSSGFSCCQPCTAGTSTINGPQSFGVLTALYEPAPPSMTSAVHLHSQPCGSYESNPCLAWSDASWEIDFVNAPGGQIQLGLGRSVTTAPMAGFGFRQCST